MEIKGKCALCHTDDVALCDSHIFPEFLYEGLYEPGQQGFRLFSNVPGKPSKKQAQGIYERLLCLQCERFLNVNYENYAKKEFFSGLKSKPIQFPQLFLIRDIDYTRFKLFMISLIWRAGVSQHVAFKNVNIGPHAERMRQMLLKQDPGEPHQYPCILFAMLNGTSAAMMPPERVPRRLFEHTAYRAIIAGMTWAFIVSSHTENFPEQKLFLGRDNILRVLKDNGMGLNLLGQRIKQVNP